MFEQDLTALQSALVTGGACYLNAKTSLADAIQNADFLNPYYPPESHHHVEIILLRSGRLALHINGSWKNFESFQPHILLTGTVHTEHWIDQSVSYEMFWLTVSPDGLNLHQTMYTSGTGYQQSALRLHMTSPYAQKLWQCSQNRDPDVVQFHCLLIESLHYTLENGGFDSSNYHREAVLQVKNYIDEFYFHKITLDELGSLVHYTPMHLNKLFKDRFGMPIHTYLGKIRLSHAADHLREGNVKIQDAARAAGFEDQRYFSRIFRQCYGCSPQEYRDKQNLK